MGSGRAYLAAFASVHELTDVDERRRVARQGLAMLAQLAEREPAPLEGLPADQLLLAVRAVLADEALAALDWLSPVAAAVVLFELAQALPPGTERRELGRRMLTRLRGADRDTFVRLLISLARSSPKLLASEGLRARAELVLSAPLTAPGAIGELALALLAQPTLAAGWVETPATGSLPARRLAARILAHGAREAVRRHDGGDRGGTVVMARGGIRAALARLLHDREALVWRFAGIARGLLAHVDSALADDIDRELRPTATGSELRRAAASAAAALERGGAAARWKQVLIERVAREPGVIRGALLGLVGLAISAPDEADTLATALIEGAVESALRPGAPGHAFGAAIDGAEALAELRREERAPLLPRATSAALDFVRVAQATSNTDDARSALLRALDVELTDGTVDGELGGPLAAARAALDLGDVAGALVHAGTAVEELAAAADWLERASDDDAIDRRHSVRLLRELDRELLSDNTLSAVLALAGDFDPTRGQLARALAVIEGALLAREERAESGAVAHGGLRVARLRALVRLLDGVRPTDETDLGPRLAAVRQLMARAQIDYSTLRRAVWAAMTRAGDALLRDGHAEVTDLLLAWTTAFPEDDFSIVREASMVPEVEAVFDAYARLAQATWAAADPDDTEATLAVVERVADVAAALPPEHSPRVESVRLALARLATQLGRIVRAHSHGGVPEGTIEAIADELGTLSRRRFGACQRLGLPADDRADALETAIRAIDAGLRDPTLLDESVAAAIDAGRDALPSAFGATIERVFVALARKPHLDSDGPAAAASDGALPTWVPLSRLLGSYYVVRPIGRGAAGSVLLAVRSDERQRADRELVAIKVPEYSGSAARTLSEQEFEALFREEAGALLALPAHSNLATFVTFDASARPKPILVMEFVRGTNLERTIETSALDTTRALAIIDGLLAGLEAMHRVQIAHLDIKPANVVLRDSNGVAVLVDFGLAGRRLRPGCGSAHYGAGEVWAEEVNGDPFSADVYAAACVAYEVLTSSVLVTGDSLKEVIDQHLSAQPGAIALAQLERNRRLVSLAQLLRAGLARDPRRRPTIARLRAGFAAITPELASLRWPLAG